MTNGKRWKPNAIADDGTAMEAWLSGAAFFNLLVVAVVGVLMRSYPFLHGFPLQYKNVLHGHSHFAFGGWVMPALLLLVLKFFPEIKSAVAQKHWRNIGLLLVASAYGMLCSFPFTGYGVVSIIFSTLSIFAGFYMAVIIWKALSDITQNSSHRFLKWGLAYLCLSALGPFATGPLVVMGYGGEPVYYNAIYFYLHFQYNGWFTFAVLAILYKNIESAGSPHKGSTVFTLMNATCVPLFALSLLWIKPPELLNWIGGIAALVQVVSACILIKDVLRHKRKKGLQRLLLRLALAAFMLKVIFQLLSAFPNIASLAYEQRNFVIAYLHLVLLGFITVLVFAYLFQGMYETKRIRYGVGLFFFSFVTTQVLLVCFAMGNVFQFSIPYYSEVLLFCSMPFPSSIFLLWRSVRRPVSHVAIPYRLRLYKLPKPDWSQSR